MTFEFYPDIRINPVGNQSVMVSFDSNTDLDSSRSVRAVTFTSAGLAALDVVVEGFFDGAETDNPMVREVAGSIKLMVKWSDGQGAEFVLATPTVESHSVKLDRKTKRWIFEPTKDVRRAIRTGVSDAFNRALAGFMAVETQAHLIRISPVSRGAVASAPVVDISAGAPGYAVAGPATVATGSQRKTQGAKKRFYWVAGAALAAPLLVFVVMSATKPKYNDPVQAAVSRALQQDPESVRQQIELTKETLKSMGLDPGKAGDTGCFAPK
jgi:hypothetical protein